MSLLLKLRQHLFLLQHVPSYLQCKERIVGRIMNFMGFLAERLMRRASVYNLDSSLVRMCNAKESRLEWGFLEGQV